MFTQSAPAIVNALSGVLPDNAVRALTQALGNCQQPLMHRGDVAIAPQQPTQNKGVVNQGGWNPQQYQDLFPQNYNSYYFETPEVGGYTNGNWFTTNYGGNQFSFPTNQEFFANEYYGGPTFNVGGNSFFDNTYTNNVTSTNTTTQNLTTQYMNGFPVPTAPSSDPVGGEVGPPSAVGAPVFNIGGDQLFFGVAGGRGGIPSTARIPECKAIIAEVEIPEYSNFRLTTDCKVTFDTSKQRKIVYARPRNEYTTLRYLRPPP